MCGEGEPPERQEGKGHYSETETYWCSALGGPHVLVRRATADSAVRGVDGGEAGEDAFEWARQYAQAFSIVGQRALTAVSAAD
jgi:hypothetical protein